MRPFNLEEAKAGKLICDREGKEVKFVAHVPEARYPTSRVVVLINGLVANVSERDNGLYMLPSKRPVWITVYKDYNTRINDGFDVEIHTTKADSLACKAYLEDKNSNVKVYPSFQIEIED